MALCKAGGGVTDIRGSISGNTFSRNRGGMIVRSRTVPTNTRSSSQSKSRSLFAYLTTAWNTQLDATQRTAWGTYASAIASKNKIGESIHLTGQLQFIRSNQARMTAGLSLCLDGPAVLSLPGTDPSLTIVSASPSALVLSFSEDSPWVTEDDAALSVSVSRPQSTTKNYFTGPWRIAGAVLGSSTSPPRSPAVIPLPFPVSINQRLFAQVQIIRADGRVTNAFRLAPKIGSDISLHLVHREVKSDGALFEDFESLTGWTVGGIGCTQELSTDAKQGSYSLKLTSPGNNTPYTTKIINHSFATTKNFILWVYVSDKTRINSVIITISSTSDLTKKFVGTFNLIKNGWQRIVFDKSKFINTGAESWSNTMIRLRVEGNIISELTKYICFDDLRTDYAAKPKVIITDDDGYQNFYDNAVPIMSANAQKGVLFIITSLIGTAGKMTMSTLSALYAASWDISNHTKSHLDLTTLPEEQMHSEIDDATLALAAFESKKFISYPFGTYNQTIIEYLKAQSFAFARAIYNPRDNPQLTLSDDIQYQIKSLGVVNTTPPATVLNYIDQVIEQSGLLIIYFHQIVNSGADELAKYLTADFLTISNYLKTKSDAGLLDVETLTDYYSGFWY